VNKSELINRIADEADLSLAQAGRALEAATHHITSELAGGGSVSLVGFGTFQVKARAARTGRNPQTGEALELSATKAPSFKAGKALKEAVNHG